MGNFNAQYKDYYNRVVGESYSSNVSTKAGYSNNRTNSIGRRNINPKERIIRTVIIQSYIVLLMIIFVLGIRVINNEFTIGISNKISTVILGNDIYPFKEGVTIESIEELQNNLIEKVEGVISTLTNSENIFDIISTDFLMPVSQKAMLGAKKEYDKGIVLSDMKSKEVYASYRGKVKGIGENEEGKYVIINHGNGVESMYGNLDEVYVSEGDMVLAEYYIGDCKKEDKSDNYRLVYKILYMGSVSNPEKYFSDVGNSVD